MTVEYRWPGDGKSEPSGRSRGSFLRSAAHFTRRAVVVRVEAKVRSVSGSADARPVGMGRSKMVGHTGVSMIERKYGHLYESELQKKIDRPGAEGG